MSDALASTSTVAKLQLASHVEVMKLLREAQSLGARYYKATGKPLGVTGEVAEFEAADKLRLRLCDARTAWYDAVNPENGRKVQIKGRAVDFNRRYRGMCPAIKCSNLFDDVALVLLDKATLQALEIWVADAAAVTMRVSGLSSARRRNSGTLASSQFKSIEGAKMVWLRAEGATT